LCGDGGAVGPGGGEKGGGARKPGRGKGNLSPPVRGKGEKSGKKKRECGRVRGSKRWKRAQGGAVRQAPGPVRDMKMNFWLVPQVGDARLDPGVFQPGKKKNPRGFVKFFVKPGEFSGFQKTEKGDLKNWRPRM